MRVAYHSDSFAKKARFGLARYSHSLRDELVEQGIETIPFSTQSDFGDAPPDWLRSAGFRHLKMPRKLLAPAWTLLGLPRVEWMLTSFDVLHSIDVDYRAPTAKPWVVTVHDLGPLTHPDFFSSAVPWLLRAYVRQMAARADRILCVSQSTADEVASLAGVPLGDRLVVVEEGVEARFFDAPPIEDLHASEAIIAAGTPFLLFTGSMNPRKNVRRVLQAYLRISPKIAQDLVLVGALGWDSEELSAELDAARLTGRVHAPGYVSDEMLRALLWRADAYLYPSLYEGFGLPILEAMASGCPVITATNSSMPEVAGDAAILVDAVDVEAISDAILKVTENREFAANLRASGLARARQFSWRETAERTAKIYHELG
ncbi:glycosyltransferase family 1 protein [Sphingomonas sp. AOB5]|uniref:glycosyltransferase family 4 protein n=1 Tax=Sphingomonas sp. AOB5 TaxID=3034017 RepID=UPI0023F68508|nr:glycosyltransferase family 1 protein [Sphingomonas sp. AOB5]MDF7774415.1 glycosyltransferase family 1 protein [Sphingomonas sp. AOB5]